MLLMASSGSVVASTGALAALRNSSKAASKAGGAAAALGLVLWNAKPAHKHAPKASPYMHFSSLAGSVDTRNALSQCTAATWCAAIMGQCMKTCIPSPGLFGRY